MRFSALDSVHFTRYTAQLLPRCEVKLVHMASWVNANPGVELALAGSTDSREASAREASLTDRRVQAVRAALIAAGVEAARIHTQGISATAFFCEADVEVCHEANRRVEVLMAYRSE